MPCKNANVFTDDIAKLTKKTKTTSKARPSI